MDKLVFTLTSITRKLEKPLPAKRVEYPVTITGSLTSGSLGVTINNEANIILIKAVAELFTELDVDYSLFDLFQACGIKQ